LAEPSAAGAAVTVGSSSGSRRASSGRTEQPVELVRRGRPGQRPQHVDQRRQRHALAAEFDAAAGAHARTQDAGRAAQFPHEAGLAYAGLTAEKHHRGRAADSLVEQRAEPGELTAATHENGADDVTTHHIRLRLLRPSGPASEVAPSAS
jgi:hypothetical protein